MKPTLMVLAAGIGSRYGGFKQVEPVGPSGEMLIDYAVFDALRSGFGRVVFVIRRDLEEAFHERIGGRYTGRLAVDYAFQEVDDLPAGFCAPEGRVKPWGTAHAVRAARRLVREPFVMINADDFYGLDAIRSLAAFLTATAAVSGGAPWPFAMTGYRLANTLSPHGAVARGVCRVDARGMLAEVLEMTRIVAVAGGAENREAPGAPVRLTGDERVSMNIWAFTPALFDLLEARFPAWLSAHGSDLKSEWFIPQVVNELIHEGCATVRVLPSESAWFGMTYREDRPRVAAALAQLARAGAYPARLWDGPWQEWR